MHNGWHVSYNEIYVSSQIRELEYYLQLNDREASRTIHTIGYEIIKDRFHEMLEILWSINSIGARCLSNIPFDQWIKSYDEGLQYDHMTSNLAECINSIFKRTRHLSITSIVKETYFCLAGLLQKRVIFRTGQTNRGYAGCVRMQDIQCRHGHIEMTKQTGKLDGYALDSFLVQLPSRAVVLVVPLLCLRSIVILTFLVVIVYPPIYK
ncbi:hypothetical protein J1N35_037905 [Gossypium stocksii]|uniref:Uncharacterized protein n=1 Tax=Gossypium stocksii TaxID=47602 RepID=A0A9D3UKW3_9ROSI|nr:hypothetical protein J1N35_037905 [Gossypium stocksii]